LSEIDNELIERVKRGDSQAFGGLIDRHRQMVVRVATRLVGDQSEALDIAQDVFLAAYVRIQDWRPAAEFSTWLYRIAVNKALEHSRKRTTRRRVERDSVRMRRLRDQGDQGDQGEPRSSEESARLSSAMRKLSQRQRAVVTLRFFEGLSVSRTARILETSANNVRVTLFKALESLRRIIGRKT